MRGDGDHALLLPLRAPQAPNPFPSDTWRLLPLRFRCVTHCACSSSQVANAWTAAGPAYLDVFGEPGSAYRTGTWQRRYTNVHSPNLYFTTCTSMHQNTNLYSCKLWPAGSPRPTNAPSRGSRMSLTFGRASSTAHEEDDDPVPFLRLHGRRGRTCTTVVDTISFIAFCLGSCSSRSSFVQCRTASRRNRC
jgi:hypothetical protein